MNNEHAFLHQPQSQPTHDFSDQIKLDEHYFIVILNTCDNSFNEI